MPLEHSSSSVVACAATGAGVPATNQLLRAIAAPRQKSVHRTTLTEMRRLSPVPCRLDRARVVEVLSIVVLFKMS